ncbi:MAG TPA: phosphatase [Actinomycetota bacterium]
MSVTVSDLRDHLLATGLAGDTATPRSSVVGNAEALAAGDPDKHLGVGARGLDATGVMAAVAELCGCSASLDHRDGPGTIDPDRTLRGLEAAGELLERAARDRVRMLVMTGHPTGLMAMYQALARALAGAGVRIETPLEDVRLAPPRRRKRPRLIRYADGVGVLCTLADMLHTHESWPMAAVLDAIEPPGLVLADHGYAGEAVVRGLPTISFTDVNDPAIAVAYAAGLTEAVVPLDDNLRPGVYEPIARFLTGRFA